MECAVTKEFQGTGLAALIFILFWSFFHSFTLRQLSQHFKLAPE